MQQESRKWEWRVDWPRPFLQQGMESVNNMREVIGMANGVALYTIYVCVYAERSGCVITYFVGWDIAYHT